MVDRIESEADNLSGKETALGSMKKNRAPFINKVGKQLI